MNQFRHKNFSMPGGLIVLVAALTLQACSSTSPKPSAPRSGEAPGGTSGSDRAAKPPEVARPAPGTAPSAPGSTAKRGGYYMDDGPGDNPPDIDSIADAVPKLEPLSPRANRPYVIFGTQYSPMTQLKPFRERGMASWYGRKFHGQMTSIGERYDMYAMTAAHPYLPLPSYARVTNVKNGKSVVVRVNDRGPFLHSRIIDLSYAAAAKLGYVQAGSAEVEVELIDRPDRALSASPMQPQPTAPQQSQTQAPSAATQTTNANTTSAPTTEAPLVLTNETVLSGPAGAVFLQLGAFGGRDAAEAMRQRLSQQFSWIKEGEGANKADLTLRQDATLFKLQYGPFKTRQEALTSAERIRQETGLQAFLVSR